MRHALLLLALSAALGAQSFEAQVRPILERNCLGCHNSKLRLSSLSFASRADFLQGGKRGPIFSSEAPDSSRILQAIRHEGTLRMPPASKLPAAELAVLEKWIAGGALWPESARSTAVPKPNHWSFRTPERPTLPAVKNTRWARTPIDRFVLARLEKESISPSPEAPKSTLVRRLFLDVTGLPPSPEQVDAFLKDANPNAWPELIDSLLASPHYAERWARHWLDQARYADSDGGSRDEPRQIWRYRDWVIDAFHNDMPFDQFVIEQLAGDLLPNPTPSQLTATGFHRNSPIQIEAGTDREQYRVEAMVDRVDTTGTVLFGMSVGCARCHDHKYDPISHREYYQLFAFFNSSDDWGESRPLFNVKYDNLHHVHGPLLELAPPETVKLRDDTLTRLLAIDAELAELRRTKKLPKDDPAVTKLDEESGRLLKVLPKKLDATMIMRELPSPRETRTMRGGDYLSPGEKVSPGTPAFLHPFPPANQPNRLHLARWLTDPANPLLARVTVNRIWMQYFGHGLVETENDFGTQGTPPSHPELLDFLSTEFIRSGWSQKAIHRLILNSAVYRQSSIARPDLMEKDPRNELLARQTRLRLDAEIVRDVALATSGLLVPKIGGPSVFPPQPEAAMSASQIKKTWTPSRGEDRYRRGMYTFFWRITPNPALVVFDAPSALMTCTRRNRSNTPLQALTLLNESAFHEFAQSFTLRLFHEEPTDPSKRLARAFQLTFARQPQTVEKDRLVRLLSLERDALRTHPGEMEKLIPKNTAPSTDRVELAAWVSLARVLFNTDEFITRE